MGSDFRWKIVAAHKRKYCYSSKFHNSFFFLFNQADCELHWLSQFSVSIRWVAQAVSRWQMSRAQLKWLQSNAAQTKATAKTTKYTNAKWQIYNHNEAFRALKMRCKFCSTVYILYLCFYFHLAERQNLDDCFAFLSFSLQFVLLLFCLYNVPKT